MFPSLDLVADDVGVAASLVREHVAEIATAKKLKFSLALRELLGGKIKMTEVTLIDPGDHRARRRRPGAKAELTRCG